MNNPLARSLTLRLLAIFSVIGIAVLVLLAALFSQGMSGQWQRNIQPHLSRYVAYVHQDLGMPPEPARADSIAAAVPVDIALFRDDQFVYSTGDGHPDIRSISFERLRGNLQHHISRQLDGERLRVSRGSDGSSRVMRVDQGEWTVIYTLDPRRRRSADRDELFIALAAVATTLLAGWWIIRQQLKPITAIKQTVASISEGDLHARTSINGRDDLATLGTSIDGMAARLQKMLDAKRELLLSVSHELRSPLTRARVALELLPPSTARERVGQDLLEMSALIEGLLESERLREAHAALDTSPLDIGSLVVSTAQAVADKHSTPLELKVPESPLIMNGDAARLGVLVRTLVHNACIHGARTHMDPSESTAIEASPQPIKVVLSESAGQIRLDVEDNGPGIADDQLERVTEAFERLDPSRSRNTGGVGLGLTLARLVAQAHGGTLQLENRNAGGLRARVRLPGNASASEAAIVTATTG